METETGTQEVNWKEEHAKLLVKFQELHKWWVKCGVPVPIIPDDIAEIP